MDAVRNLLLVLFILFMFSCNMSDQEYNLPSDYIYFKEGGNRNVVLRNHKSIIDHSALGFSYNDDYVMFVFDTVQNLPPKIDNEKLFYLIHDIKKNILLDKMNYENYKLFVKEKKIDNKDDLSLKIYIPR